MGRPKKKKKKLTGKTILVCLILIFLVYMIITLVINSGGSLITYVAREGEESESFIADGYIFKDQTIITSPKDGYLECFALESGRVSKNGTVAYIYDNEVDTKTKNRLFELERKIAEAENNNRSMSASENDAIRLEQDISRELLKIAYLVRDKDMTSIFKVRENLEDISVAKRKISGDDPSGDETLAKMKAEKAELERKSDVSRTAVNTDISGSFTARVDGLEQVLDDEKIESINQAYLMGIKSPENRHGETSKVKSGEAIGKVVDTYTWYFATIVDKDISDTLKTGDRIRLKFLDSSDNIIDGAVYKITDEKDNKAVVVVKSAAFVENLYSMSKAKVEIIKRTYEGIKIPAKSVRIKDDEKGVYIVSGNTVKFRNAEVYYIDDEWAVVSREEKNGIKLYDEVIVSGSNLYEGKVVR